MRPITTPIFTLLSAAIVCTAKHCTVLDGPDISHWMNSKNDQRFTPGTIKLENGYVEPYLWNEDPNGWQIYQALHQDDTGHPRVAIYLGPSGGNYNIVFLQAGTISAHYWVNRGEICYVNDLTYRELTFAKYQQFDTRPYVGH